MPPVTTHSLASTTPRLVLYQQTHHTPDGTPISIQPLVTENTRITHLYVAAFHLNDGPGNITLNDHSPSDSRYNQLWSEVRELQDAGVKVMAMLGGAAKGSFERLSGNDHTFEAFYMPFAAILRHHAFQGVDLDVEEPFSLSSLERLLRRLKSDFGSDFIITLAPVATAMLPLKPYLVSLVRRLLSTPPSEWEHLPEIFRAFLRPGVLKSMLHLSGFNHFQLETSEAGKLVDWYNVQMYNGWGDASSPGLYRGIVDCGWKPERIVLGVLTNPLDGPSGHVEAERLKTVVQELKAEYGDRFGGLMGWEYFNAGEERSDKKNWEWVREMGEALGLKSLPKVASDSITASTAPRQHVMSGTAPEDGTMHFPEEHIRQLVDMGIERAEALNALDAAGGDVELAGQLVFGDEPS